MHIHSHIYPVLSDKDLLKIISGSNQNAVLFVHNSDDKDHMELLLKILSAIGYSKDNILMMELPFGMNARIPSLFDAKALDKIVLLGIHPKRLCFNMVSSKYETLEIKGQELLLADSLADIAKHKELKRNLWIALKEMFGV